MLNSQVMSRLSRWWKKMEIRASRWWRSEGMEVLDSKNHYMSLSSHHSVIPVCGFICFEHEQSSPLVGSLSMCGLCPNYLSWFNRKAGLSYWKLYWNEASSIKEVECKLQQNEHFQRTVLTSCDTTFAFRFQQECLCWQDMERVPSTFKTIFLMIPKLLTQLSFVSHKEGISLHAAGSAKRPHMAADISNSSTCKSKLWLIGCSYPINTLSHEI